MSAHDFEERIKALHEASEMLKDINMGLPRIEMQQADFRSALDTQWILVTMTLIFAIQIGTTLFEAGSARRGNSMGIIFKNLVGTVISGFMFWFWGWALSFGHKNNGSVNGFVGNADLLLVTEGDDAFPLTRFAFWSFQFALCNQATQIFFGATTERLTMFATYAYSFFFSCFVYPVIAHWIWSESGWLSFTNTDGVTTRVGTNGLIDLSGATVVHMLGGIAAFAGAAIIGERKNRDCGHQSQALKYLGAAIVWFGYFGFSCGATHAVSNGKSEMVAKIAIAFLLSAGGAVCTVAALTRGCPASIHGGAIAGLVSISGAASVVEPWAAFVIGIVGGGIFFFVRRQVPPTIDDATNALAIHGAPGAWGALAVGVFATEFNTIAMIGRETDAYGFIYGGGANQFGVQLLGVLIIAVWGAVWGAVIAFVLKVIGKLRVDDSVDEHAMSTDCTEAYSAAYLGLACPRNEDQEQAQEGAALQA